MKVSDYKLIIFDLDGTLSDRDSDEVYPYAKEYFDGMVGKDVHFVIATNQGGVGLRHWMETEGFGDPEKYPTVDDIENRIYNITQRHIPKGIHLMAFACYAYQSKKSNKWGPIPEGKDDEFAWSPFCRKPSPGMLNTAMNMLMIHPGETLMVGDSDDDRLAAEAAHCDFQWAWQFFGQPEPVS